MDRHTPARIKYRYPQGNQTDTTTSRLTATRSASFLSLLPTTLLPLLSNYWDIFIPTISRNSFAFRRLCNSVTRLQPWILNRRSACSLRCWFGGAIVVDCLRRGPTAYRRTGQPMRTRESTTRLPSTRPLAIMCTRWSQRGCCDVSVDAAWTPAGGPYYSDDSLVNSLDRGEFVSLKRGRSKTSASHRDDAQYLDEEILDALKAKVSTVVSTVVCGGIGVVHNVERCVDLGYLFEVWMWGASNMHGPNGFWECVMWTKKTEQQKVSFSCSEVSRRQGSTRRSTRYSLAHLFNRPLQCICTFRLPV